MDLKELVKKSSQLRLLYVEDNEDARNSTKGLLSDFFSDITVCVNGEDGLEKFKNDGKFDIVITDINMPKMDGLEMSKKIKEIDNNVEIIVVSAHNEKSFIDEGSDVVDGYLFKPLDMMQFLEELTRITSKLLD